MRQWSASPSSAGDEFPRAVRKTQLTDRVISSPKRQLTPRLSLPQRPVIVESTLADAPAGASRSPAEDRLVEPSPASAAPALPAVPSPLLMGATSSDSGLHWIPRTLPAIPSITGARQQSSTRMTILKLSIVGVVLFSVLGATLATAGSGKISQLLFSALDSSAPYNPLTSVPASQITKRVQPLTQANQDAGYDTQQQHDMFWNSACSAAVLTELLRAWGVPNITIGHIIDEMTAHSPPYITPWGGLMSQNGWTYIAQLHEFQAKVQLNRSLSYNDIVRVTQRQGIPVVLGLRDNGGRFFPAFGGGGHFLIAVGGDGSGLNIVDSSLYKITYLPYNELNYLWTGETVVITPL